jgi:hypothetical protein
MDLQTVRDASEVLEALLTSAAIVVGGVWTYALFVRQRLRFPRADLELASQSYPMPARKQLVHVALRITNTGSVLLRPDYAELRLRQVLPVPEELSELPSDVDPVPAGRAELEWPMLVGREWQWGDGELEIEPGETDTLHADFVVEAEVRVMQLYAYVRNPSKRKQGLGWSITRMDVLAGLDSGPAWSSNA